MGTRQAIFMLFFTLMFGMPAHAGMYKLVNPDGTVTYTDRAPDAKSDAAKVTEIKVKTYPEPANVQPAQKPGFTPSAISGKKLTMFSAAWCGVCRQAKAYLNAQKIPYDEVDVDSAPGAARFAGLGGKAVPMFQVGTATMTGFSPEGIAGLLGK